MSTHTIRQYQQIELIPSSDGESGYSDPHIHAIKLIKLALSSGLSLREVIYFMSAKDSDEFFDRQQNSLAQLYDRRDQLDPSKTGEFTQIGVIDCLVKELATMKH